MHRTKNDLRKFIYILLLIIGCCINDVAFCQGYPSELTSTCTESYFTFAIKPFWNPRIILLPGSSNFLLVSNYGSIGFNIIKLNNQGDTLWSKTYQSNNEETGGFEVVLDKNNDLLITGNFNLISKVDTSGNLKWSKVISINDQYSQEIKDMICLDNGDIAILFYTDDGGILGRFDNEFTSAKWLKFFDAYNTYPTSMVAIGNKITVAGSTLNDEMDFYDKGCFWQFDVTDGSYIKEKRYKAKNTEVYINDIQKMGTNFFASGYIGSVDNGPGAFFFYTIRCKP